MYSASAFAANTVIRSATAASFPLFTVQLFTNVSRSGSRFMLGFHIDDGDDILVGCKLGEHFAWLYCTSILAVSLLIL